MDRHFLVAVSEDKSALHGIRFLGQFFLDKARVRATLFHSLAKPPALDANEAGLEEKHRQAAAGRKLTASAQNAMDQARQEGIGLDFPADHLAVQLRERVFSKVADIIHEGERGNYDAVILGRRGLSMLEAAFEESLSQDLFQDKFSFPLWLCRPPRPGAKDILLYADGSPASFTMADHVGFVAGLERRHRVDVFVPRQIHGNTGIRQAYEEIFAGHGLSGPDINWLPPAPQSPARAIVDLARHTPYAAVAAGRSSPEPSLLARLFRGPVCSVLFRELDTTALWICH